ncbi:MAG: U32 family peptidase [Chloroflexi bacterium]|nr:U32 family peptidase [Chloroflexota bacterium]
MELVVPTTFEPEFLPQLQGLPVRYVYGSLPDEPGMRPMTWVPQIDETILAEHAAQAAALGIDLLYVFNASCLGAQEFSGEGQRWLAYKIGQWQDWGIKAVTVANPYFVHMIKLRAPEIRVHVSMVANIDTLNKAQSWERLGADVLNIHPNVNRDFAFLQALRQSVRCDLVVLVNEGCLLQCYMREYHANNSSHAIEGMEKGYFMDYCSAMCARIKIGEPAQILKSPWVLPEDLELYEALGIHKFKIAGRDKSTEWVLRAIQAYSARRFEGNLMDLVTGFTELDRFGAGPVPVRVDAASLRGFLAGFQGKDCRRGCGPCTYCDQWAERCVDIEATAREHYLSELDRTTKSLASGTFRARLAGPAGAPPK